VHKYMGHEHKYMGHETANWGGRGLGYMLFNEHLCNQPCPCKVVVGPGARLCTLLEEWVLGVGMSTLGRKRLCTPRIGDSQVPTIRMSHTNCLQMAIKTLQFNIGASAHKYIGHEIANWWGWGGRRSEHCREVWVGGRRDAGCGSG
jgi:hypothetical protein